MGVIKRPFYQHSSGEDDNVISFLETRETILEEGGQNVTHLPSLLPPGGRRTPQGFNQPNPARARNQHRLQRRWSLGTSDDNRPRGLKKRKRFENHKYLLSLAPEDGEPLPSIPEHGESSFAPLFRDEANMQAWNAFLAFPEEEQLLILQRGVLYEDVDIDELAENFRYTLDSSLGLKGDENRKKTSKDGRWVHPGYSAEEAYRKLCPKVKSVLKRKHFPLGNLIQLEEEVTDFFQATPHGIFIKDLQDSFLRLLLHALCTYNGLHSQSSSEFDRRQTLVRNFYPCFAPPELSLAQYIEKRFAFKRQYHDGN